MTKRQYPSYSTGSNSIVHGTPTQGFVTFDECIGAEQDGECPSASFVGKDLDEPQRGKTGSHSATTLVEVPEETDGENTYKYDRQCSDGAPNATVAGGLGKRQIKMHVGKDVKMPNGNGTWFETDDGDDITQNERQDRIEVEAILQRHNVPEHLHEPVVGTVLNENNKAWSSFGGKVGTAAALLLAWGCEKIGKSIVIGELESRLEWWRDVKGIKRRQRVLETFCDRIVEQAEKRELV